MHWKNKLEKILKNEIDKFYEIYKKRPIVKTVKFDVMEDKDGASYCIIFRLDKMFSWKAIEYNILKEFNTNLIVIKFNFDKNGNPENFIISEGISPYIKGIKAAKQIIKKGNEVQIVANEIIKLLNKEANNEKF